MLSNPEQPPEQLVEHFSLLCVQALQQENVPGASIRKVQLTARDDLSGMIQPRVVLDFYGVAYDWPEPVDHNDTLEKITKHLAEDTVDLFRKMPAWAVLAAKAAGRIQQYKEIKPQTTQDHGQTAETIP